MYRHIVRRTVPRLALGTLLALCPLAGYSLGLGKLQLKSALNEPLNAEIDLTSVSDSDLKGLNVSLAPRADYEAARAERLPLLSQIKFIVAKRPDGRHYLQLKTDAPIEEPFLHMLLQLEWPGGRLVREYTALIDPPSYMVGKAPTIEAPQADEPEEAPAEPQSQFVETVPPPQETEEREAQAAALPAPPIPEPLAARSSDSQPVEEKTPSQPLLGSEPAKEVAAKENVAAPSERPTDQPSPESQPARAAAAPTDTAWANAAEYTVRPGDTLWAIADRLRTDKQLTLEQIMVAIFRNNKDAFFRNNVNNLRAGKVLKMPEQDEVDATPPSEAVREFRAQYDAWQEYKLKLAGGSRTLKVADSKVTDEKSAPAAAVTAKPAEKETPAVKGKPAKESQELLKIVRGSAEGEKQANPAKSAETESAKETSTRERAVLAERVTTLEESLQSKQLENRELSEKVGQVRTQIKSEKRLIELENQVLAQKTAKPAEPKPPAVKPEVKAEAPPRTATAPAPVTAEPKKEPEAKKEPEVATATPAPVTTPVKKPGVPAPAPPPPEKGFLMSLLDDALADSTMPLLGGAVALAGVGILFVYMRRRRRSIAEFEESILASDAIASDATGATSSADTTGQVTSGDTSFLSDFSKSGMGQVHTDEVDPIAEAEVYLAYGRDETAEEILKEAIIKNPERHELKQKLLEIYHQRNDVNGFETLAEELYAALGGRGGKIWEKVEEMGKKLNADNPMFRGGAPGRRAADKPAERPVAQGMRSVVTQPAASAVSVDVGSVGAATRVVENRSSVDFDFDASPAAAEPSLEFDVDAPSEKSASQKDASGGGGDFGNIEFGSRADNLVDFESAKGADAAPASGAEDDIKWELDTPVAAAESADAGPGAGNGAEGGHWDETATKLDLAKAYIDMGDSEGARSILDEVLAEGNEQQKKQAAELAAQIA
jgi:pilus assembly protein FimV